MSIRQNAEYWLKVFQILVRENEHRRRMQAEERINFPCDHCKGSVMMFVRYQEGQLFIEARCFNEDCPFPKLEGQFTWDEVHDEAIEAVEAAKTVEAARTAAALGLGPHR